jgi:hypothetical protein
MSPHAKMMQRIELMKLFSQRQGLKPSRLDMQTKDMDADLRSKIWNALHVYYWEGVNSDSLRSASNLEQYGYLKGLWHGYFKRPLDTLPAGWSTAYQTVRKYFFNCEWYEVYDFIEFTARTHPYKSASQNFRIGCNRVLEQELSGYRFVGDAIAPITDDGTIAAIEQAQESVGNLPSVMAHLRQALSLFSDRKQPDYRNSIKESISAVEAISRLVSKNPKVTLGEALKVLAPKVPLHPALSGAFEKLYGYTSDANGIRHALLDESNLEQEDALFMLVSCSAFINYLTAKCARANIKL